MIDNVLIIAYQFPPMGGSGVQRTSKFVKHLSSFGYEPIVLTRDTKDVDLIDESLLKDIPEDTKIIRTKSFDYSDSSHPISLFSKVLARKVLIPDQARLWEMSLHKEVLEIIRNNKIKVIYSTSYPYSDHLLALYIKKTLGDRIKWVCDFRDEWANNPYTKDNPHSKYRTKREFEMEVEVIEYADKIIANTPVMRKNFIDNHNVNGQRALDFITIPNGYDADDFDGIDTSHIKTDKFIITYTGALYGRRKPDYFFQAIEELIKEEKIEKDKLQINFIGNYKKEALYENVSNFGIESCVKIYDYMPHRDALKMLISSNALLLIEGGGVGSDAFYTGKVFEYMYANRPVIAVLPKGCASDIVKETNIGLVSDFDDVEKTKDNVVTLYKMWENDEKYVGQDFELIKTFERSELTRRLADVFDDIIN